MQDELVQAEKTTTADAKDEPANEISGILRRFLVQLDALVETALTVMVTLVTNAKKATAEHEAAFNRLKTVAEHEPLNFDAFWEEHQKLEKIRDHRMKATEAMRMFPQSSLVSMVSQFDAFFSSMSRTLFLLRPEKIRVGDRSISVSELIRHKTIEDALTEMVNDEVDEILRGSHLDHLEWVSKKFDFKIDVRSSLIERFVEITERRNICVHSDGRVSKQYLQKSAKLNKDITASEQLGEWVPIQPAYLRGARDVLFEVAFRLVQAAWRKARPDHEEFQTDLVIETGFDLLIREDYNLAKNLYAFALELRGPSERDKKLLTINSAIAHTFSGSEEEAIRILDKIDWSASEMRFKLAVAVLRKDYERALLLMKNMPTSGEDMVGAEEYRTWPLFRAIRNEPTFRQAFQDKFGQPYQGEVKGVMAAETELAKGEVALDEDVKLAAFDQETVH